MCVQLKINLFVVFCVGAVSAEPVLRYKLDSCNSLEPSFVNENWQYPGGGDILTDTDLSLFDSPKKSSERNPPFTLKTDFKQYRRNREYKIHLETSEYFDSFMLHARGADRPDGNATLVGWFVALPSIAMDLHCLGKRKSSVVNRARPVKIGNLTFTWRAPPTDYGSIKFVASIVKGNSYAVIETKDKTFNGFPVSIRGCGREMSCFRQCSTSPTCPPDESSYMVVINMAKNRREVIISLGGIVENEKKYVAFGIGDDKKNLQNMDISACFKDGKNIQAGHYLLENSMGSIYLHRSPIILTGQDMDKTTNFIWCQFRRPIMSKSMWELDLSHPMFHFYFVGEKNGSMITLPKQETIWNSQMRRNFSEIANDIMFSGYAIRSTFCSLLAGFLVSLTITMA